MEDILSILVFGDIHGRDFWKKNITDILNYTQAKIVFLGDYLDVYEYEGIDPDDAVKSFEEILNLKKQYPNRIILLLGNHDMGYRFSLDICDCRTDRKNYKKIQKLFQDNKDLFSLAYETYVNGKHFIFSHAGIHKGYIETAFPDKCKDISEDNVVDFFNTGYANEDKKLIRSLAMYDNYRGWSPFVYGSLVWADIRSWFGEKYDGYGYQIVGHTQLQHGCGGLIDVNIANLDSAEAFVIDNKANLKPYAKFKEENNITN